MPGELELAVVTPHHAIVCRLEHDGRKLEEGRLVFIQVIPSSTEIHSVTANIISRFRLLTQPAGYEFRVEKLLS